MHKKVAVVTGANKGIGFAIVKGLCQKFNGTVFLTARNTDRGCKAASRLEKEGFEPIFYPLDITDQSSINRFRNDLKEEYGGIDVLVNNAAIAFKHSSTEPFGVQAEETIRVNYFGLLMVCHTLFPLLRPRARVVNLSSAAGLLYRIPSSELRAKLSSPSLTEDELSDLMREFVETAKNQTSIQKGWGNSAYAVSKVGVSALTFIQQREFDKDSRQIVVNAVHPGYVNTDMTSHMGFMTIEQGAKAPLFLALQPPYYNEIKGQFVWKDKTILDWKRPIF